MKNNKTDNFTQSAPEEFETALRNFGQRGTVQTKVYGRGEPGGGHSPNVKVWEVLCEVGVTGGEGVLRGLFPLPVPSSVAPPHGDPPLHTDPPPGALYDTGRAVGGWLRGGGRKGTKMPNCGRASFCHLVAVYKTSKQKRAEI